MDLSSWMERPATSDVRAIAWNDAAYAEKPPNCPPALWIRIERCLGPEDATEQLAELDVQGVYCLALGQDQDVFGIEPWTPASAPPEGRNEMLVAVRAIERRSLRSAQSAGGALPDFLSRNATRQWIEAHFESGNAQAGAELALRCPPGGSAEQGVAAWTREMPRLYAERWEGEDLRPLLPLLWFDGPGAERFRWRFRALVAELFRANFLEPIAEWCQGAELPLVCHLGDCESLLSQTLEGWGPAMRLYEAAGDPALSDPGTAFQSSLAIKQAVSIAQQMERRGVLSEMFDGRQAPQSPLADFRAQAERSLALGASLLARRATPGELRGVAKRIAGPSAPGKAQPWWDEWQDVLTGLVRLSGLMRQGTRNVNVLVLSPADSIAAHAQTPLPPNMAGLSGKSAKLSARALEIESHLERLLQALHVFQIDFDLCDEDVLERHGNPQANTFWVGAGEYSTVIVPPAYSWRASTLKRLRRYARKGGCLIVARPIAPCIDFEPSPAIEDLAGAYANVDIVERAGREVCFQLNRIAPRPVAIRASGQETSALLVQHRSTETHDLFLVANTSRTSEIEAEVLLYADGAVRVLDAYGPHILVKDADEDKNAQKFRYNFHPGAATLFAVGGEADLTEAQHQRRPHATSSEALEDAWEFERLGPNLLPLRECRVQVDAEPFAPNQGRGARLMPVEFARVALDERRAEQTPGPASPAEITLSFSFDSQIDGRGRSVELVLEPNPGMEAWLNGEALDLSGEAWLFDPAFKRARVGDLLRVGENLLEVRFPDGAPPPVIETPILAGDFAVTLDERAKPTLTTEPSVLRNGSWTEQGYPYYAGRMRYRQEALLEIEPRKRYFLKLHGPAGAAVAARIGEHKSVALLGAPWRLEITRLARSDFNTIEIEIASTLQNLWGPIHSTGRIAADPRPSPDVYDLLPARDRRYWNRQPTLTPFGPLGGGAIETYDPSAPPPKTPEAKPPIPAESSDSDDPEDSVRSEESPDTGFPTDDSDS